MHARPVIIYILELPIFVQCDKETGNENTAYRPIHAKALGDEKERQDMGSSRVEQDTIRSVGAFGEEGVRSKSASGRHSIDETHVEREGR
eukprot:2493509-Pleurochrysis_carterae.AAC.1